MLLLLKSSNLSHLYSLSIASRAIHTTSVNCKSLKNFRKFPIPNIKGAFEAAKIPIKVFDKGFYDYPMSRDPLNIRYPGYWFRRKFVYVKEMEPELMVPDLNGFQLKPYVSYRVKEITSDPLTAEELFKETYGNIIIDSYMAGERMEIKASREEAEEARLKHLQTGADMFCTKWEEAEELTP